MWPLGWAAMVVGGQDEWQVAGRLTAVAGGPSRWHQRSWPHLSIVTGVIRVFRCCFVQTASALESVSATDLFTSTGEEEEENGTARNKALCLRMTLWFTAALGAWKFEELLPHLDTGLEMCLSSVVVRVSHVPQHNGRWEIMCFVENEFLQENRFRYSTIEVVGSGSGSQSFLVQSLQNGEL